MTRKSDFQEWFEARRDAVEKARAERRERRLMNSSTWDALMENIGPVLDGDVQIVHEDVMADTLAVEQRRWTERGYWVFALIAALGIGGVIGWYMQPQYEPKPWDCTVKVMPEATLVEPTIMRCVGGEMPE